MVGSEKSQMAPSSTTQEKKQKTSKMKREKKVQNPNRPNWMIAR